MSRVALSGDLLATATGHLTNARHHRRIWIDSGAIAFGEVGPVPQVAGWAPSVTSG